MAKGLMDFFKLLVCIQFLWGFIITGIVYYIPGPYQQYTSPAASAVSKGSQTLGQDVETSLENQSKIPFVDMGALVFHSGIYLVDLVVNIFAALPEMLTLLLNLAFGFLPMETHIIAEFKGFVLGIGIALYSISLILLLLNLRSQGSGLV